MRDVTSDARMARLIKAARGYETWAFDELYTLYADKLYRFILFRVSDEALAEDLVAEVFLRVLKRIDTFEGKTVAAFSAWLYRVARNLVTDQYRRHAKRETAPLEKATPLLDARANPVDEAEKKQTREELLAAIGRLTPDQQQVILFKFYEDMGNAQVANLLGKTEGAVKSLQHRALATLERFLGA